MRDIILFDTEESVGNLLPISFTRPVSHIRVGITTIYEKWASMTGSKLGLKVIEPLSDAFVCAVEDTPETLHIPSGYIPDADLVKALDQLESGQQLLTETGEMIAYCGREADFDPDTFIKIVYSSKTRRIKYVFDIFLLNGEVLEDDYYRLTLGRESQPLSKNNTVIGEFEDSEGRQKIFIEEGAVVEGAVMNVKDGPIYVGRDAKIMEGSCVRGPLALCPNAQVRMGAKIYGATTLGPYCKAGGELSNVVMIGYSNKAHDGYLGNAVIGEWCNIGAGVNASNLKNDYTKIRIWNYIERRFMKTDLQFCGLIMGDHSKAGVNCMFNTATVLGVGVNVHGSGFPRVFVPSFSEGSSSAGFSDVSLKKFFDIAERVMSRRGKTISERERRIYEHVYAISQSHKGGR